MSTRYDFVCISHEPWISQNSDTQYNLEELVTAYKMREDTVTGMDADQKAGGWAEFPSAAYFLSQHRHCRLLIETEYGDLINPETDRKCEQHRRLEEHDCPVLDQTPCGISRLISSKEGFIIRVTCDRSKHTGSHRVKIKDMTIKWPE